MENEKEAREEGKSGPARDTDTARGKDARKDARSEAVRRLFEETFFAPFLTGVEDGLLPVDISRDQRDLIVRASLPGLERDEVAILIEDGVLSIETAWPDGETEAPGERYYRRERHGGYLSRKVALPVPVVEAGARARLEEGVLTLRLPLLREGGGRLIDID